MNRKCPIYSFWIILLRVGASQMTFDNILTCFQYICTLRDHLTERSLQNHEFS